MSEETNQVFGIDLGTTYSAISYINEDGKPQIINNTDGSPITASAVYFETADNIVVGETAKDQGKIDSSLISELIKRDMGTRTERAFHGTTYNPEEISAIILRYLVKGAEQEGKEVKDVVITCPAYFGMEERAATRAAGKIAGLNVIEIIDEPIAAALSYDAVNEQGQEKNVIVYDLGGGTFDVTVVKITDEALSVICSDGNHRLGGADWDARLEALLAQKFMEQCPSAGDPREDPDSAYDLHNQTEKVKKRLSSALENNVAISHNGERAKITVSRQEFEEATRDLLEETIQFTDEMIEMAKSKGVTKFDDFLLVGGSTYMPQVRAIVEERYKESLGLEPKVFEPNYAVSKGAAVYGQFYAGKATPTPSPDVCVYLPTGGGTPGPRGIQMVASKSYGILVLRNSTGEEVCFNMIKKQTPVPATFSNMFPISEANATTLPLKVYTNDVPEQITSLDMCPPPIGEAIMELPSGLPAGAEVFVEFTLDKEGMLSLHAVDQTTKKEVNATFQLENALSAEEIEEGGRKVGTLVIQE